MYIYKLSSLWLFVSSELQLWKYSFFRSRSTVCFFKLSFTHGVLTIVCEKVFHTVYILIRKNAINLAQNRRKVSFPPLKNVKSLFIPKNHTHTVWWWKSWTEFSKNGLELLKYILQGSGWGGGRQKQGMQTSYTM